MTKKQMVKEIIRMLKKSNDIELIDLIYMLLLKSSEHGVGYIKRIQ